MAKQKKPDSSSKEVRIYSLATTVNECIIFLEEVTGNRLLPIWIGLAEGQAIAIRFSGIVLPRPLTHDLMLALVQTLGWKVDKVVVNDLKENTFYAKIHISKNGEKSTIDSRPSDAIAVAVRAGCSIFVEERVFQRCQVLNKPITEDEVKNFKKELSSLKPEDIFKDLPEKKEGKEKKGKPPPKQEGGKPEEGEHPEKGEDDE